MRPRFSLRWLLIAFTIMSVAFYILIIRPTTIAQRFVTALNRGDVTALRMLADGVQDSLLNSLHQQDKNIKLEDVKFSAEIRPQTWRDIYKFRRDVWLHLSYSTYELPHAEMRAYLIAENGGLRLDDGS